MTAAAVEDIEVVFEEAVSWLPSHILDEAVLETKNQKVFFALYSSSQLFNLLLFIHCPLDIYIYI